jgi:hypothetical protein
VTALFEAVLDDRSVVRIALLQEHIQVVTPYGKLEVPATQVRRVEFTPRPVPDAPKRVKAAIEKLKSDEFTEREAGTKELLALGLASYHPVLEATRSEDLEVKKRAQAVLEKLEKKYPAEELRRKPYDLVHTPTFTIAGQIQGASLKVKNAYFGEAQLKLGDLRSLASVGVGRDMTLALDASRYAMPGAAPTWLATNVTVRAGGRLLIKATGEIDMYPMGGYNGQYMARPGGPKWAGVAGGKGAAVVQVALPGMVMGRIGTGGKEFVVGEKYEGTPGEAGTLYLRIAGSPWNNASTGEYKVSIQVD